MSATIGPDNSELFLDPRPHLLARVSGSEPAKGGLHLLLGPFGVRSTQRLTLSGYGDGLIAALFPAELKPQASALYGQGMATPMIAAAKAAGWTVRAGPHLAFRNSKSPQRLYMSPSIDPTEYVRRWEEEDLDRVGQYGRNDIKAALWPWLRERGYLDDGDEATLAEWVRTQLGNRPVYLRPGLRLMGRYAAEDGGLAEKIRCDVNAILAAANEPPLPATRA